MSLLLAAAWRAAHWVLTAGEHFKWQRGVTAASAVAWPIGGMAGYLLVIVLLKNWVQRPLPVPAMAAAAHNLILCVGSGTMLLGCASALVQARNFFCSRLQLCASSQLFSVLPKLIYELCAC